MTPETTQEALLRDRIFGNLSKMFDQVPNATYSLWSSVCIGVISEEVLMHTYEDITAFLNKYPQYARIILYLPFELLPHFEEVNTATRLHAYAASFVTAYKAALRNLISEQDTKALFVDGDVPEPELGLGAGPIVVKAAQLLPELFFRNLLTEAELEELLGTNSLAFDSLKEVITAIAATYNNPRSIAEPATPPTEPLSIPQVVRIVKRVVTDLEKQFESECSTLTPSRAQWLREKRLKNFINTFAREHHDTIDPWEYVIHNNEVISRIGIASLFNQSEEHLRSVLSPTVESFTADLLDTWSRGTSQVKRDLEVFIAHMTARGYFSSVGKLVRSTICRVPRFEQFWSNEVSPYATEAIAELHRANSLAAQSELGNYIYPITIAYGSHIKGYGMHDSDIDIACIVKPGTPFETEARIQELIKQQFGDVATDRTLLFWTKVSTIGIEILPVFEVPLNPRFVGDMMHAHILLQSNWIGQARDIEEIQSAIRNRYASMHHPKLRALWIRSLEHDVLQYRLLHKGYAHLFPRQVPWHYATFETGGSFWDSGFRRLATLLYLKKVVLPTAQDP